MRTVTDITPALVAILLITASVHAQKPAAYVITSVPAPRDPLPRFTIAPRGGALGPVGLPLPPIGLQSPVRSEHPPRGRRHTVVAWPMMMFYVPVAPAGPPPQQEPARAARVSAPGRLILDVEPATAQVFADGYYVGTPEDFSAARGGGVLEAGTHRIDVTAAGHESMTIDVRANPGQPLTIRSVLKVLPPPAAVPPTTFYLIPGCYMGNIPPSDAGLPPSCDQSRAIQWTP